MEDFIDEMIGSIQTFLRQLKEKNCHKGSRCGCQSGSSYNRRTRKLFVGKIFSGSENEEILCCSQVWVFGMQFAMRAGQDHRYLTFKSSQLSLEQIDSRCQFLQYMEIIGKTKNRGLCHQRDKSKVVGASKNLINPEHCPVELYKKQMSHVPTKNLR